MMDYTTDRFGLPVHRHGIMSIRAYYVTCPYQWLSEPGREHLNRLDRWTCNRGNKCRNNNNRNNNRPTK